MLTREEIEQREDRDLKPCAAKSRLSRGRSHVEEEHDYRTCFQRDRDRVVHSAAFRRLEYKTQVFVNHEGDYYRTRLTHTMEMAQIGRSIGRVLGLNEDLIEAVALAHDLGHTPFGHSGEKTLNRLMEQHGGFEHNRQSLRIVEVLEIRYPEFQGLNLTYEVRESLAKHSSKYDKPGECEFDPGKAPLLEGQVVDIADSIAYDTHDLDDGLKARILKKDDLMDLALWRRAASTVDVSNGGIDGRILTYQTIRSLINLLVTDLVETSEKNTEDQGLTSVDDVREKGHGAIGFSDTVAEDKMELETFLYDKMYQHYRIKRMAAKAGRFIERMFDEYTKNSDQLPPEYQKDGEKELAVSVCDYLAGMTDRFAQDEYKRLFHPFEIV